MTAVATFTPAWLTRPEAGLCPCGCIGKRRRGSFVEKTVASAARLLHQAMFSDDIAAGHGFLQRIDARVKVIGMFGLLVVTALLRSIPALIGFYALALALAAASALSLSFFVKRVWLFIPIFTGVIVLPATLNVITPGRIVVPLGSWFGTELGLTSQGLTSAGLIVARVATSISLVVLLTLTTPWSKLLAALRALFVPRMFILVLGMTYRYLFHLIGSVTDMYTARKARTVSSDTNLESGRAFVAASAGALFGKANAMAEEVHMAMTARGFTGDIRTLAPPHLRRLDVLFVISCAVAGACALGVDRVISH